MALDAGTQLGPYEVLAPVGTGGMGEVYKARDLRLDRVVALKVLPRHLAGDAHRKARFDREARLISQLNHPHICTLHDIGTADGVDFIIMEFVEGETLARRILGGTMPVAEALPLFLQIADALHAAHAKGVIHRDLKPANIQITPGGKVKILDFGIAKALTTALDDAGAGTEGTTAATVADTHVGAVVGTAAYMSPEQARGRTVDRRTDIWAFGCCLYEALSGRSPFRATTTAETMAAVLEREPDWAALPPATPALIRRLLRRCLQKDPEARQHDMADVRIEIGEAVADPTPGDRDSDAIVPGRRRRWPTVLGAGAGALAVLVAAALGYRELQRGSAPPRLANPTQVSAALGLEDYPTWSPDGRTVAYESNESGNWDVFVSQTGGGRAVNRTADHHGQDRYPSWSPDGRQIAFWSERDGGGYFVMPALGGPPQKIASVPPIGWTFYSPPEWSPDGSELAFVSFGASGGEMVPFLGIVSVVTRESRRLPIRGTEEGRFDLAWSPDGRWIAYVSASQQIAETTELMVVRLSDGETRSVTDTRMNVRSPRWSPDGRYLFYVSNRDGAADIWRQRVDGSVGAVADADQVTAGLEVRHFAFSRDGRRLTYSKGRWVANVWRVPARIDRPATWADARQVTFEQAFIEFVDVSPDGGTLAFSSDRMGNQDLWTMPVEGGELFRLTSDPSPEWAPRWSHDGTRISFYSFRSHDRDLWVMPATGGPATQLTSTPGLDAVGEWSPDDRQIAFRSERNGNSDVYVMDADGTHVRCLTPQSSGDYSPSWSPDGRWLAYFSNRGGPVRIWRVPSTGGEPERLTQGPGVSPKWSRDGKRIYFPGIAERAGNIWAVSLDDRREYPVTDLTGRRGDIGFQRVATDGPSLYFTWRDDVGDIWAMDVVKE